MDNMTLMISQEGDLVIDGNGIMQTIEGVDTTAQNIRMTLKAGKEDFPLVPEHGTDYGTVFKPGADDGMIGEIYREAIFQETDVAQINELSVTRSNGRDINVSFAVVTEKGLEVDGSI